MYRHLRVAIVIGGLLVSAWNQGAVAQAVPAGVLAGTKGPRVIVVVPGVNQVVSVSQSHLNRIVTPFERPAVRTADSAETKIEGNVIYVAPDSDVPVTLFITPGDDEETAISLTLAPRKIPPVEVRLKLAGTGTGRGGHLVSKKKAERWETSQPYVDTLTAVFRRLANEELPSGYALSPVAGNPVAGLCRQRGVEYTTGQVVTGRRIKVYIGTARITGTIPMELDERGCSSEGVMGVAGWPGIALYPNKPVELYVAIGADERRKNVRRRPSLLNTR